MSSLSHPFQSFIDNAVQVCQHDPEAIGVATGGSWLSGEIDAYLDLVLITTRQLAPDVSHMRQHTVLFGTIRLLSPGC